MRDFTLQTYKKFLTTFRDGGYLFYTFAAWCKDRPSGKILILRHDIDKKPENALKIALLESELGVKSTYYFLAKSSVFKSEIIKKIADLGHEIAYHYRDLVDAKGDESLAIVLFKNNLDKLRSIAPIETIAMDGCPWSKYDNRNLWKKYDYRDLGLIGEPYFDFLNGESGREVLYFTDTARMWDGGKYNVRDNRLNDSAYKQPSVHTTFDLIEWIKTSGNQKPIMITTHPQRWTDNKSEWLKELVLQLAKNRIKRISKNFFF